MTGIVVIEVVTGDVSLLVVDGDSCVTVGPDVATIVVNAVKRNNRNKVTVIVFFQLTKKEIILSSQSKCLVPLIHLCIQNKLRISADPQSLNNCSCKSTKSTTVVNKIILLHSECAIVLKVGPEGEAKDKAWQWITFYL